MATKTVWIFEDERFETEDECRECVSNAVLYRIDTGDERFKDWIYGTRDGFICGNYEWSAWEVLEGMGADFRDFADDYCDYVFDREVECDEVPLGWVFTLDGSDKVYKSESDAKDAACMYALETFADWLDTGRDTRARLSNVLSAILTDEQYSHLQDGYIEECFRFVREAEREEVRA